MTKDLPNFEEMFWPTIEAIKKLGGSATIQELRSKVIEIMKVTDEQLAIPKKGHPEGRFLYNLAWVCTYLKKVGVAENSVRGVWSVTNLGATFTESQLKEIPKIVNRASRDKSGGKSKPSEVLVVTESEAEESEEVEDEWKALLLERLQNIKPGAFEKLCQRLLREIGFTQVVVTGRTGDGGIDGIGILHISLLTFRTYFQCKRFKNVVTASMIRDFRGAMSGRSERGIFFTTGRFTQDAIREANREGVQAIELINGEALCEELRKYRMGIKETAEIDENWFNSNL